MAPRVLIVDDQREVSRLLKSALETIEQGLLVAEAPSGEEAMLEASRTKVDLLVADFRLPGITGVELMKKMKARNPDMKVILITGVTDPRAREEISRAGADGHFTKPVPMADFLDAVERTLGLVRTILPASSTFVPAVERKGMADLISGLRHQLNAQAVVLLNERGLIKAQAGELPESNMEVSFTSTLMAICSASRKISSLVGHNPSGNVSLFRSDTTDMIFTQVGPLHAILIAGKNVASAEKWAHNSKILNEQLVEILQTLEKMGVTGALSPSVLEEIEARHVAEVKVALQEEAEMEEIPSEFDELLSKATNKKQTNDADAFWDHAAEKGTAFVLKDTLSFEEASKLGLTPDE
jgi:DNA-binding NarL/FixJ family response regulator